MESSKWGLEMGGLLSFASLVVVVVSLDSLAD